jgi:hypothetical protein|uniref:Uncharacterized protein n=1 Tax=Zea mays TaxID=4577 RepID=A0A804P7N3_MAIZE
MTRLSNKDNAQHNRTHRVTDDGDRAAAPSDHRGHQLAVPAAGEGPPPRGVADAALAPRAQRSGAVAGGRAELARRVLVDPPHGERGGHALAPGHGPQLGATLLHHAALRRGADQLAQVLVGGSAAPVDAVAPGQRRRRHEHGVPERGVGGDVARAPREPPHVQVPRPAERPRRRTPQPPEPAPPAHPDPHHQAPGVETPVEEHHQAGEDKARGRRECGCEANELISAV